MYFYPVFDMLCNTVPIYYVLQILNLINALENRKSPLDLARMPPVVVESVRKGKTREFIQKFRAKAPFFTGC